MVAPRTHVKVCGVTSIDEAVAIAALGVSAIGLNFVPASPRYVSIEQARAIARAVRAKATSAVPQIVGVVANRDLADLNALKRDAELDCLQLHGSESPSDVTPLLPHAYKAVRVAAAADVEEARAFPGEHILVDAKVDGQLGGTGTTFDWSLVRELARERKLTLAGGLDPRNVARAIAAVAPYCVDVASGVESQPGVKDLAAVEAFVAAAHAATRG